MSTLSANRRIRIGTQPIARCEGSTAKQAPLSPEGHPADGFLKHRFLPLCEPSLYVPDEETVTGGFFQSLGYLCRHYRIEPMDVSALAYPANVLLATWQLRRQFKKQGRHRQLQVVEQDNGEVQLKVTETLDTGNTLFYIPVIPLYHWHNKRQNRKTAELLLGVCAYFFYEAGVPYFRDPDTYMEGNYAMMQDWVDDDCGDMDSDDLNRHQSDLNRIYHYGDRMERRVKSKTNLKKLAERVAVFTPANEFQAEVKNLAERTLRVWAQYPNRNIYQNEHHPDFDEEDFDDDYYNFLHMHEYVGFIGEASSALYDSMMDMINNDLNERSKILEPQVSTVFDTLQMPYQDSLGYEQEAFDLISELCTLLNELP